MATTLFPSLCPAILFSPFLSIKESGVAQPDWPRLQICFAKAERHLIRQLLIKPDVPEFTPDQVGFVSYDSHCMTALAIHACKCAHWFVSCRSGIPSQNPRGRGAGHSLIWSKICAAEQDLVLRVLSLKHVIQFYYLTSSTREVILDKKLLKECNGSREAVHIQTRYFLLASPKKEQTNKQNKQTERTLTGTPQQLWPFTNKKTRNIKKHGNARKTTAIDNKLLDKTRDEHYYILKR